MLSPPRFIYTLSANLDSFLMLWWSIWLLCQDLTHHQCNTYAYNYTTWFDVLTPQTTSLSYKIIPRPQYTVLTPPSSPSTSPAFHNANSFGIPSRFPFPSLAIQTVKVLPASVPGPPRTFPNRLGFSGYCLWNSSTACKSSTSFVGSQVKES